MQMLTCRNCGHEFSGEVLLDELGWHAVCPKCESSFDVYLPEKRYVIAIALMPDNDYETYFVDEFDASGVAERYAYSDYESLLAGWREICDDPPSMWYWIVDVYSKRGRVETFVSGAIDPIDEETIRCHFGLDPVEEVAEKNTFITRLCDSLSRKDCIDAILRSQIAAMLINARVRRNLTRQQLGDIIDVPAAAIGRWENCDSDFRLSALANVCAEIGVVPTLQFIADE